jgi:ethanolamine utilization protein EutQ
MKKLITAEVIETLHKNHETRCETCQDSIITLAARDLATDYGIVFVEKGNCDLKTEETTILENLNQEKLFELLKLLSDKGVLNDFLKPYLSKSHDNGLKVVDGASVKMEVFDTGTPGANVLFQEVVHKEESKVSAGFLTIDKSRFEWALTYEEIDYVIDGTLTVEIDGKVYTAKAGDVVFVPKGSTVVWGSPDVAHIFYATYPANWAEAN